MIEIEAEEEFCRKLKRRKNRVLSYIARKTGFDKDKHTKAATSIINKYGLIRSRDNETMKLLNSVNTEALKYFKLRQND